MKMTINNQEYTAIYGISLEDNQYWIFQHQQNIIALEKKGNDFIPLQPYQEHISINKQNQQIILLHHLEQLQTNYQQGQYPSSKELITDLEQFHHFLLTNPNISFLIHDKEAAKLSLSPLQLTTYFDENYYPKQIEKGHQKKITPMKNFKTAAFVDIVLLGVIAIGMATLTTAIIITETFH